MSTAPAEAAFLTFITAPQWHVSQPSFENGPLPDERTILGRRQEWDRICSSLSLGELANLVKKNTDQNTHRILRSGLSMPPLEEMSAFLLYSQGDVQIPNRLKTVVEVIKRYESQPASDQIGTVPFLNLFRDEILDEHHPGDASDYRAQCIDPLRAMHRVDVDLMRKYEHWPQWMRNADIYSTLGWANVIDQVRAIGSWEPLLSQGAAVILQYVRNRHAMLRDVDGSLDWNKKDLTTPERMKEFHLFSGEYQTLAKAIELVEFLFHTDQRGIIRTFRNPILVGYQNVKDAVYGLAPFTVDPVLAGPLDDTRFGDSVLWDTFGVRPNDPMNYYQDRMSTASMIRVSNDP